MLTTLKNFGTRLSALALVAVAFVATSAVTLATDYNFASSTEEILDLQTALATIAMVIVFGAIAAFIVVWLGLVGANYVKSKFSKFTGLRKKI